MTIPESFKFFTEIVNNAESFSKIHMCLFGVLVILSKKKFKTHKGTFSSKNYRRNCGSFNKKINILLNIRSLKAELALNNTVSN